MQNFSLEFWRKFIETNNDFSETCVIKNAIDDKMLDKLNAGIMEVLKNRLLTKEIDNGFRLYIEGNEQDDEYLKKLCETPPKTSENISDYTKRIFNKKFGFIINSGERHSDYISKTILNAVSPLIKLRIINF